MRFNLPGTYRQLLTTGIKEEFSMGYGAANGFRASYPDPFYWYDIEREETTNLKIHPFCFMDSVAIFDQKLSPSEALKELNYYYGICKKVKGSFISIMHNHLMGNNSLEWRNVYEEFLLKVCNKVNA